MAAAPSDAPSRRLEFQVTYRQVLLMHSPPPPWRKDLQPHTPSSPGLRGAWPASPADLRRPKAALTTRSRCPRLQYEGEERDMALVQALVDPELSEPYSIFTYRRAPALPRPRLSPSHPHAGSCASPALSGATATLPLRPLQSSQQIRMEPSGISKSC